MKKKVYRKEKRSDEERDYYWYTLEFEVDKDGFEKRIYAKYITGSDNTGRRPEVGETTELYQLPNGKYLLHFVREWHITKDVDSMTWVGDTIRDVIDNLINYCIDDCNYDEDRNLLIVPDFIQDLADQVGIDIQTF